MHKAVLFVTPAVLAISCSPLAASETWLVTEESAAGIKSSQGTWTVNTDGNKMSGVGALQANNGNPLTYKFEGAKADGVYTVTITERSDGKKGCVWSGHAPAGTGVQTRGLVGYAECEDGKLIIRASIASQ
jgi:hypothetical protein